MRQTNHVLFAVALFALVAWEFGHLRQNPVSDSPAPAPDGGNADPGSQSDQAAPVGEITGASSDGSIEPPAAQIEPPAPSVVSKVTSIITGEIRNMFGTPYDDLITSSAKQYGLDAGVLYKLLYTESHFRPDIIDGSTKSPVGALGIAQFMPATALQELGSVAAALDPKQAIPGAARYLAKLIKACGGNVSKGVAAYNWGLGNVQRKGLAAAPQETINYVGLITGEIIG